VINFQIDFHTNHEKSSPKEGLIYVYTLGILSISKSVNLFCNLSIDPFHFFAFIEFITYLSFRDWETFLRFGLGKKISNISLDSKFRINIGEIKHFRWSVEILVFWNLLSNSVLSGFIIAWKNCCHDVGTFQILHFYSSTKSNCFLRTSCKMNLVRHTF